ncbi:MAG: gamma-glutamyltransferase [Acidobacteriota bacterium]
MSRERRIELSDTEDLDLSPARLPWPQRVAASRHGMVATAHYRATEAAVGILSRGGNAVDAAVAAAFALGVCEPAASGLGGQTMMLVHLARTRRTVALDGSSRAPNRATPGVLTSASRLRGHTATTVPSTPATLDYALRTYGTMPLAAVLEPAISLAEDGFQVTELLSRLLRRELGKLRQRSAGPLLLRAGTRAWLPGQVLRQPALAKTLRRLAREGIEDFYTGKIGRAIQRDMQRNGGLLHGDDLAQIPWPIERRPIGGRFGASRVLTFPPPAAGRTLIEMLNVLAQFPRGRWGPDTPQGALILAEIVRRALRDRRDRPFDPNYYPQIGERRTLSEEYAREVSREIRRRVRRPLTGETTHLSCVDRHGNIVSLTQSIERVFGSMEACPELGFLYNNYMSAFEYEDAGHPYYLRPNAAPWASVAPTIAFRGRRPWVALGSPGSERITSSLLQVLVRLERQTPYDAVAAPRLHCSLAGKVSLEASRMRDDIPGVLREHGFEIDEREPWSFYLGCVQLVVEDGGTWIGVADPRRDGSAGGPRN